MMNRVEIKVNEVVVKRNNLLIALGVAAIGMGITAVLGLVEFLMLGPPEPGDEFMQAFTLLYIFAGTVLFFGMGVYSITSGFNRIVIDSDGVFCKGLFGQKKLIWQEISDCGLFLSGGYRRYNEYILYFSREVLPLNKKRTKKKIRRRTVFAYVYYRGEDIDRIVAFCRRYSSVPPFIRKGRQNI